MKKESLLSLALLLLILMFPNVFINIIVFGCNMFTKLIKWLI